MRTQWLLNHFRLEFSMTETSLQSWFSLHVTFKSPLTRCNDKTKYLKYWQYL